MAITLLSSGVSVASFTPNVSVTNSVSIPVGTNRRLFVCCGWDASQGTGPTDIIPAITYNGVAAPFLSREPDGSFESYRIQSPIGFSSRQGVAWYGLREAELAALSGGLMPLTAAWDPSAFCITWQFCFGYFFLGNCNQNERVRNFSRSNTTAAVTTRINTPTTGGGVSDATLVAVVNNTSAGTIQITINAAPLVEDFDVNFAATVARFAAANVMSYGILGAGNSEATFTLPANPSVISVSVRIAEFFPVNGQVSLYDGFGSLITLDAL